MINVVLYEPEIAENTGNIMRTCAGFDVKLHLIEPLGFYLDKSHLKRYSANYFEKVNYELYDDFADFLKKNKGSFYFFTRYGHKTLDSIDYKNETNDIYLIFGSESRGIPKSILQNNLSNCLRIPITDNIRCLNLSNSVAIGLYEVIKQRNYSNLLKYDNFKGKDFLTKRE